MCNECFNTPCLSGCPNEDDIFKHCYVCESKIVIEYLAETIVSDKYICEECIKDLTIREILDESLEVIEMAREII